MENEGAEEQSVSQSWSPEHEHLRVGWREARKPAMRTECGQGQARRQVWKQPDGNHNSGHPLRLDPVPPSSL